MEPDQEQTAPEAEENETGRPAQTVRVPNVSPGAKSGLDHHVIGADALSPDEDADEPEAEEPTEAELAGGDGEEPEVVTVPEGLEGAELDAWVSGDAVEGDETENPDRWAAYQSRRAAAGLEPAPSTEAQGGDASGDAGEQGGEAGSSDTVTGSASQQGD